MKTFRLALVLVAGCSREPQTTTSTVAPADPRPAATVTSTIGSRPVLATAGSPPPVPILAPGTAFVTVGKERIDVQPLLPRAQTAFHIQNRTDVAHEIVIRNATSSAAASLPPRGTTVVQLLVGTGAHDITCTTPGHQESARFETYAPGVSLDRPAERRVKR